MITNLIEIFVGAFPMWKIPCITIGIIVISTFYLYYKQSMSIDIALSLQFLWFLVPISVISVHLAHLNSLGIEQNFLEIAGHIGSGIVFGLIVTIWLYVIVASIPAYILTKWVYFNRPPQD